MFSLRAWWIVPVGALALLLWMNLARAHRVDYVSNLGGGAPAADASSSSGYQGGVRHLLVPEHNSASYQWIVQVQQMVAQREWRLRHVDYDNAPSGREVSSPSPYRWWLALIAELERVVSGGGFGRAVERAALLADPALHLLLVAGTAVFVAWQFGAFPAVLTSLAVALLFPFSGLFLPGQPTDSGLAQACLWGSTLLLLAGIQALPAGNASRARRWFPAAGVVAGLGLWINVAQTLPWLAGVCLGGIANAILTRLTAARSPDLKSMEVPWRAWALGGAGMSLVAYLVEYFPGHLGGLRLDENHPVYGLAWLGAGELLAQLTDWGGRQKPAHSRRAQIMTALVAVAAVLLPAWLLFTPAEGMLLEDASPQRLTNLPASAVAANTLAWIRSDGVTAAVAATLLPALVLVPAAWMLARRRTAPVHRTALAVVLGPALVALAFALGRLRWWNIFDTSLLGLLVATTTASSALALSGLRRWLWAGGFALCLAPGIVLVVTQARDSARTEVTESDVTALMERDLAHWLANQATAEGGIVLAPPNLTSALLYYGNLKGLATPYRENKSGFLVAMRIAGATSPDEAQAVARGHGLDYIVVPSWDPFLDEFGRLGSKDADHALVFLLHRWLPPRWLRPVPYDLPKVPGIEGRSLVIFKVVDVQDNVGALSRLAEYFVEMGQLDHAVAASQALQRLFPGDLGALVARALVARAAGDGSGFGAASTELGAMVARGEDRELAWDRRVSLAIALAEGKSFEAARHQVQRCLDELDEARLRSLTTLSLYRLQAMNKAFGLAFADPKLRALARQLLPVELREGPAR